MTNSLFEETLKQLFTHLGMIYPEESGIDTYPALVLDEQMIVHFVQQEDRIDMVASLGSLPDQALALTKLLILNYSEETYPICFASDVEGNDLLAIIRLPVHSDHQILLAALQSLVAQIESIKTELKTIFTSENTSE